MRELSVPPIVTVGSDVTLTDPVWRNAEQTPRLAMFARRDGDGWQDVTAATFRAEVMALARGLIAAGVAAGDRIALMSRTRYEWTLFDYAIWTAGGVVVPIYETSSPDQVEWIINDSGAVGCVVETSGQHRVLAELRDRLPKLKLVWQIDSGAVSELVSAGASVDPAAVERRRRSRRADDLATRIYTSGTTGRPKGCALTHRNIYSDVANAIPGLPEVFHEGSSTLLFLPLAHSFARLIQVSCVEGRAKLAHTADVTHLLDELASFRPTFILSVPRVFEKIYNAAKHKAHASGRGTIFDRADRVAVRYSEAMDQGGPGLALRLQHRIFDRLVYSKLRTALGGRCERAISGGAPLGTRLAHFFRGIGVTVYEGYGLTETSPGANINLRDAIRIGTVGRPLPGVSERIADDGEILIKGDVVFQGYWNNPAATAEAIDADGWFHTGDIGELDSDGYLTITGRKKEMIVTAGGKNVAPALLEDRVRAHPLVSQCVVVGDHRPFIAALVTLDPETLGDWLREQGRPAGAPVEAVRHDPQLRATIQVAIDEANRTVSRAESIRAFRILPADFTIDSGDLTPSLKVKRNVVMKEYADEITALYS